ncbi:MAG: hypothetical protein ACP5PZ_11120, partial [Bacteroidales bacterium]
GVWVLGAEGVAQVEGAVGYLVGYGARECSRPSSFALMQKKQKIKAQKPNYKVVHFYHDKMNKYIHPAE